LKRSRFSTALAMQTLLACSAVVAQETAHATWEAVLVSLRQTSSNVWLASTTLRPGEFWFAGGSAVDTAWIRHAKDRGLIAGGCPVAQCPTNAGTIVVLFEVPREAATAPTSVRVVRLVHMESSSQVRCGDSTAVILVREVDMESFIYTLQRRHDAWVVTNRVMTDGGHGADSAAVAQIRRCELGG
jgi:hypothetical protein